MFGLVAVSLKLTEKVHNLALRKSPNETEFNNLQLSCGQEPSRDHTQFPNESD